MADPFAASQCSLVELRIRVNTGRGDALELRWALRRQSVYPAFSDTEASTDEGRGKIVVAEAGVEWPVTEPSRRQRIWLLRDLLLANAELDALLQRAFSTRSELLRVEVLVAAGDPLPWEAALSWYRNRQSRHLDPGSYLACRRAPASEATPPALSIVRTVAIDEAVDGSSIAGALRYGPTRFEPISLAAHHGPPPAIVHIAAEHLAQAPACRLLVIHARERDTIEQLAVEAESLAWQALLIVYDRRFDWPEFYRAIQDEWPIDRATSAATARPPLDSGLLLVLRPEAETCLLLFRTILALDDAPPPIPRMVSRSSPIVVSRTRRLIDELRVALPSEELSFDNHVELVEPTEVPPAQVRYTTASLWRAEQRVDGSLVTDEPVSLRVSVEAEVEHGVFAAVFPDERLRELAPELRTVELTVLLFFEDRHWHGQRRASLQLPPTGSAREPAVFELMPRASGPAPLRIGLYYRNVLLQSVSLVATVREAGCDQPDLAPRFELDWATSTDLALLHELDDRQPDLNIFINEQQGSHWIGMRSEQGGPLDGRLRSFPQAVVVAQAEAGRAALQKLHKIPRVKTETNAELAEAERGRREQQLIELARTGRRLHQSLLVLSDDDDDEPSPETVTSVEPIGPRPPRITIARVSTDAPAFPWALLYERKLDHFADLHVCPHAWDALADPLAKPPCASSPDCQAQIEAETVCPYGFWGLRYVIEQPLGRTRLDDANHPLLVDDEVLVERKPRAAYCFDDTLDRQRAHANAIADALGGLELSQLSDVRDVHRALTRPEASIYYFLCHGERRGGSFVLKLRKSNAPTELFPEQLELFGQRRPFVAIINACDSVAAREDTINQLIVALRKLGGVAVVGTEIEVLQSFAQEFGVRLVHELAHGRATGELLLQLRRETLARGLDLSGLAYTVFGAADVRLV